MSDWQQTKDAVDVCDYTINWYDTSQTPVLAADETISTSTWSADTGITIVSSPAASHTDTTTTVWLSGGTVNTPYKVYNTIVTSAGRTYKRYIEVTIMPIKA
jgi:hypothetical protein